MPDKTINTIQLGVITLDAPKNKEYKDALARLDDSYNPFEHRNVKNPVSDVRSLANLLKASLGSGFLAMPLAFSCAGLVTGTIGTIIIGYICTHCAKMLVRLSQELCFITKNPSLTYGETCYQTILTGPKRLRKYATFANYTCDISLALTNLSANCVYVVLMANSIEQLIEDHYKIDMSSSLYCLPLLIPLILIVHIKNMKNLAPFSAIAIILLISVSGISFYFIFKEMPSFDNTFLFMEINRIPLFISTVIFAMEGIGCVMPIENEMSNPSHFLGCPGVLNTSMSIVVVLYTLLGFFGYAKYGDESQGSITLNLDMESIYAMVAKICITISIFFTYPLQYYVPADIFWKYIKPVIQNKREKLIKSLFLTSGVIVTVAVGMALPNINHIIELVGAIFYSTLGLVVPALLDTIYQWERHLGRYKWKLWKNLLIMAFGFMALVCGVLHAVYQIIE